jgi:hypothetical protein
MFSGMLYQVPSRIAGDRKRVCLSLAKEPGLEIAIYTVIGDTVVQLFFLIFQAFRKGRVASS